MEYYTLPVTVHVMYIMINNVQFCLVALVSMKNDILNIKVLEVSALK